MKKIVEYKLHGGSVPYFIEDGGHFLEGGKMIGMSKDSSECHVPAELVILTRTQLIDKVKLMDMSDKDGAISEADKQAMAEKWADDRGL